MFWLIAGIALVELHTPNGRLIEINPAEVSSLRTPLDIGGHHHLAPGTHCVIVMSNGGFIAVAEDCADVERKLVRG